MGNQFTCLNKGDIIEHMISLMNEPLDLEKGLKAQIGEIRSWKGGKYQKTATGWKEVVTPISSIADDVDNFKKMSDADKVKFFEDYRERTLKVLHKLNKAKSAKDASAISYYKSKYDHMSKKLEALQQLYDDAKKSLSNNSNTNPVSALNVKAGDILTMDQVEDIFNRYNTKPELADLGKRVFAMAKDLGIPVRVRNIRGNAIGLYHFSGYIEYDTDIFKVSSNGKGSKTLVSTLLHEAIHSCTAIYLNKDNYLNPKCPQNIREACIELKALYKETKSKLRGHYGATDVMEFVAELANPTFRKVLQAIDVWKRVKASLVKIFYGKDTQGTSKENALEQASKALDVILENADVSYLKRSAHKQYKIEEAMGHKHFF